MNTITVIGTIASEVESYNYSGLENFYTFKISTTRDSGTIDLLPVVVPSILVKDVVLKVGNRVAVEGEIRTKHFKEHKQVYIFSKLMVPTELSDECYASVSGKLNSKTNIRYTPLGRMVFDFTIATPRNYNKLDYIPCIAWNRSALLLEKSKGRNVNIKGRLQSRDYIKNNVTYTLNELSVVESEVLYE